MPRKAEKEVPSVEVRQLLPSFLRALRARNCSPDTLSNYRYRLQEFDAWLTEIGHAHTVASFDKTLMERFLAHLADFHTPGTCGAFHTALCSFFSWCVDDDELEVSPLAHVPPPSVPIQPAPILDDTHVRALLEACRGKTFEDRRDAAILRVFLDTGMRRQENAYLLRADVDLENRAVLIRKSKGGVYRIAALGHQAIRAIDQYERVRAAHPHAASPLLWLGRQGPISRRTMSDIIERRAQMAGLAEVGIHPHLFRHLFAHTYLAQGGGELNLAALGGWTDLRQLQTRYGAALKNERAIAEHHKLQIGDRW